MSGIVKDYFAKPSPRRDILAKLEAQLRTERIIDSVMLSFIGDVYSDTADNGAATRGALELFLKYGVPVTILTKGGSRCLRDLDLFQRFGERITVGSTLTFIDPQKSAEWESGAATPADRLSALCTLKEHGVRTCASFEPVIEPEESLALIDASLQLDCIDFYKIGKLNNYEGLDARIDWSDFLTRALEMLRGRGKRVYIKQALREAAPNVALMAEEIRN